MGRNGSETRNARPNLLANPACGGGRRKPCWRRWLASSAAACRCPMPSRSGIRVHPICLVVVLGIPAKRPIHLPSNRRLPTPSSLRSNVSARLQTRRHHRRHHSRRHAPHPASLIRHAPAAGRHRHSSGAETTGPCRCLRYHGLHPCSWSQRGDGYSHRWTRWDQCFTQIRFTQVNGPKPDAVADSDKGEQRQRTPHL